MNDEVETGRPISYLVLEAGTEVFDTNGKHVGQVGKVLAVEQDDIFDGILVQAGLTGVRFVAADKIDQLYEHRVELSITAEELDRQPKHDQGSAAFDADPSDASWRQED